MSDPHPPEPSQSPNDESVKFHGWRLLGVIFLVCLVLAGVSAVVDWMVIGPLEVSRTLVGFDSVYNSYSIRRPMVIHLVPLRRYAANSARPGREQR